MREDFSSATIFSQRQCLSAFARHHFHHARLIMSYDRTLFFRD